LNTQLHFLNDKVSNKDKQIKDLTERIVKLETQNHILKDEISHIREGTVRQDNIASRQQYNPGMQNQISISAQNATARVDLNDEKILSPDLGN